MIKLAQVVLKNVVKRFEQKTVIPGLNLNIPAGSFTVLVGPSGCGKSTILRMIAGLEKESAGEIWIGDQQVNELPPGQRDIAMVFQNYALYPMMTVRENIEFGLKNRKVPKAERKKLIDEIVEIVGLADYLDCKPGSLSGGQRQRVALARAMVKKPKVFLMDEPLSNLDAKLRYHMRLELLQLHKTLGTTFIYVTHDQVEAMSMGDQIVVMNEGKIQQAATPMDIYQNPQNLFVAQFIGSPAMNILTAKVRLEGRELEFSAQGSKRKDTPCRIPIPSILPLTRYNGQDVKVGVRPEKIAIAPSGIDQSDEGCFFSVRGVVKTREMLGAEVIYQIVSSLGELAVKSPLETLIPEGQLVTLTIAYKDLYFFDSETGGRISAPIKADQPMLAASSGGL